MSSVNSENVKSLFDLFGKFLERAVGRELLIARPTFITSRQKSQFSDI